MRNATSVRSYNAPVRGRAPTGPGVRAWGVRQRPRPSRTLETLLKLADCRRLLSAGARTVLAAWAVATLVPLASGQRAETKFSWQGQEVRLDCGVPRVGKYTLKDLEIGQPWRLGAGPASSLITGAPLLVGDLVIPPGGYRIQLMRPQEQKFELLVEGAGRLVSISANTNLPSTLSDAKQPSSKLETTLAPDGEATDKELRPLLFTVTFGAPRVAVPFTVVGSLTKKAGGATVDGFKLPAEWLAKRLSGTTKSPVATVTLASAPKDAPKVFNVLLGESEALYVAHDTPSADAFSPLAAHVAMWDKKGSVTWTEVQEKSDHFLLDEVKFEKGKELRLVARVGSRRAEIVIPLGAAPKQ